MKKATVVFGMCLIMILGFSQLSAFGPDNLSEEFSGIRLVKIKTTSGDCIIKTGNSDKVKVHVESSVTPEESFEAEIRKNGNTLRLVEHWRGSSHGIVLWTIVVPEKTDIDFSTASGDITISGVKGEIDAGSASGDMEFENCEGEIEASTASGEIILIKTNGDCDVSTASGDVEAESITGEIEISTASGEIEIENAQGSFELSCASGSIEAKNIEIGEESSFSTASGDVEVVLVKSSAYDLELSAASGDVSLDYDGNPFRGYFELTAKKRKGRISSALKFDKEEEFEKYGDIYIRKSFTKGSNEPKILMETASGKVILK